MRDGELHEVKSSIILQPGPAALTDGAMHGENVHVAVRSRTRVAKRALRDRVRICEASEARASSSRSQCLAYFSLVRWMTSARQRAAPGAVLFQSSVSR